MRRRYVIREGELVDITDAPPPDLRADSGALWSDKGYSECRALDGSVLDTRTKHRQYMRDRGLTTADDYTQEWGQAAKSRADFYERAPDPTRPHDIVRAIEKLRG